MAFVAACMNDDVSFRRGRQPVRDQWSRTRPPISSPLLNPPQPAAALFVSAVDRRSLSPRMSKDFTTVVKIIMKYTCLPQVWRVKEQRTNYCINPRRIHGQQRMARVHGKSMNLPREFAQHPSTSSDGTNSG
ncbi:hypothetical protein NECAME_07677 [Necator americanus]|uniref:Uncharacterized protein n=1 Tax=Necator americanus TaxID=51031 RepID=W2TP39_NECAM|nr:hypothetical protein NECAME_07677 [Necator americanus]ETN82901.1 hypothetical protein NECAME_07677 [Necator americanus]